MTNITSYLLQVIRKSKLSASFNVLIGVVKTLFNAMPLVLGLYTFEAVVWSIAGGYLAAAVIMMLVTVIQYRRFDIDSLDLEPAKARSRRSQAEGVSMKLDLPCSKLGTSLMATLWMEL
jgi:O-antigen/teichoic acid export membrane protein